MNRNPQRRLLTGVATLIASLLIAACGFAQASPALPANVQPTTIDAGVTADGDHFLILGTLEHGTFVSFNDGEEWTQSEGLPGDPQYEWLEPAVLEVAMAPDGFTAFAATSAGLFKSTDSGRTWEHYTSNNAAYEFRQVREVEIAPDFGDAPVVLVHATSNVGAGTFISMDGGATWAGVSLHSGTRDIQLLDDGRMAIAGNRWITVRPLDSPGSIVYSTETERDPAGGVYRVTFSPSFTDDNLVFYGGTRTGTMHRMNMATAEQIDSGLRLAISDHHCDADVEWTGYGASSWCWLEAAYLSPDFASDGTGFVISASGLTRTTDSGLTWQLVDGLPPESEPVESVAFAPDFDDNFTVYAVTKRRLLKSTDGGTTWQAFPSLDELPPIPTNTPEPTPTPRLTPLPTATAAPTTAP